MGKRLALVLALVLVAGMTCAAYAEVQNVKVSGDIAAMGVARDNFDLVKTPVDAAAGYTSANYDDYEKDFLTITRVRVDADLTDNVTATVRLLNERNWNGESTAGTAERNRNIFMTNQTDTASTENQVDLDLAYVTLKEFLYNPLTIAVGRQEIHLGNDWITGDPDTNMWSGKTSLAEGDLSARKSFDAIRATLDYNPLIVDLFYSKVAENVTTENDDTNFYGLNAKYDVDKDTSLEGFFFAKVQGSQATAVTNIDAGNATSFVTARDKDNADQVYAVGGRVVNKTVKNLTVDAESAFQFGTYNPKFDPNARYTPTAKAATMQRRAWGAQVIATYDLKDVSAISKYSPLISGKYVYLSGAKRDQTTEGANYKGWDPMYENQSSGHILNAIIAQTNFQLGMLTMQAKPVSDVTAKLDYVVAWFARKYPEGLNAVISGVNNARQFKMGSGKYIGQEVDLTLTYDYTEDVQFSLLGGILIPGKNILEPTEGKTNMRTSASEVIGSMKVTF